MVLLETLIRYLKTKWWEYEDVIPTRLTSDYPRDVIRFANVDLTTGENAVYVGNRISYIQNSIRRYAIVDAITYSGGNTDVAIMGYLSKIATPTNYQVLDTATYPISDVLFSVDDFPEGFTADVLDYTLEVNTTSLGAITPGNTNVNSSGFTLANVPIGRWFIGWNGQCRVLRSQGTGETLLVGVGDSATNIISNKLKVYMNVGYVSGQYNSETVQGAGIEDLVTFAAKTTLYLDYKVYVNSGTTIDFYSSNKANYLYARYYYYNKK